ncbi:hypothetical protein SDC9_138811 [bioreactor metagenome]|uniref:Uncharacterized protein n=1 Tax=bioreactor metagenome TaxID=1076179 RepID=A0A645DQZ4_9ZZZZ
MTELKKIRNRQKKRQSSDLKRSELDKIIKNRGDDLKSIKIQEVLLSLLFNDITLLNQAKGILSEEDFDDQFKNIWLQLQITAQAGDDPGILLINERLSPQELSLLTGLLSREESFEKPQEAFIQLLDSLKMQRGKERVFHKNTDDMKEMIQWYNQIKTRKT